MLNEYIPYDNIARIKPVLTQVKNGKRETMEDVKKRTGCHIITNAGSYHQSPANLGSGLKIDGKVLRSGFYGFGTNNEKNLEWSYAGAWHKDWFGAFYDTISNGSHQHKFNDRAKRGRTGIGINKDGIRIVSIGDSESAYKCTSTDFMQRYFKDCDYAINLDGGGSSQYDSPFGKFKSSRKMPWFLCIWIKNPTVPYRVFNVRTYLTFRDKPSIICKELGRFYNGEILQVKSLVGNYAEVVHNGRTGYVTGKYIKRAG